MFETLESESEKYKQAEEKIEGQLSKIVDYEKSFLNIENYENEEHLFLGMTYLDKCLLTEEKELKSNTKHEDFQEKDVELVLAEEMKIFTNIVCMGNIKISNKPNSVTNSDIIQVTAQMCSISVIDSFKIS